MNREKDDYNWEMLDDIIEDNKKAKSLINKRKNSIGMFNM